MQGGDAAQFVPQWKQVFFLEHHHGAHAKVPCGRCVPLVALLKLVEVVSLPPLPEVLLYGLNELKTIQAVSCDVCDVGMGKRGEWAPD